MKILKEELMRVIKESIEEALIVEELGDGTAQLEEGTLVCEACLYEDLTCGCPDKLEEAKYQGRSYQCRNFCRKDL